MKTDKFKSTLVSIAGALSVKNFQITYFQFAEMIQGELWARDSRKRLAKWSYFTCHLNVPCLGARASRVAKVAIQADACLVKIVDECRAAGAASSAGD